jgi:hypothetical protein
MTLRALLVAALALTCGRAAASSAARSASGDMLAPPIVFFVAKGAPDACGRGCDRWIAAEGQIDSDAAVRFRKFQRQIGDRHLPIYFSSPGGNLDQAVAIGTTLREKPVVARVARTVVTECGLEPQDGDVCLKLKQSGRELHGDLSDRGAMCNSACPYLLLGAATREIAPDTVLGIHSPKIILRFSGGKPTEQLRAAATERGFERINRVLSGYFAKMGADSRLLVLARTIKFEDMHILTREEIARFGIDRRELVETPWTFESNGRSMIRKFAVQKGAIQKNGGENSYRMTQWRLVCFSADQFELDFQRPTALSSTFDTVSISSDGPQQYFAFPPAKSPGFEVWGLRMDRESVQSLADVPEFEFTETSLASDGHRLPQLAKFSTEGLTSALVRLVATCPAQKVVTSLGSNRPRGSAAK